MERHATGHFGGRLEASCGLPVGLTLVIRYAVRADHHNNKKETNMKEENESTPQEALPASTGSAKIVQILIAPNDSTWQGVMLGLGDDGVTYHCKTGHWEPYIPQLGYSPNTPN